MRSILLPHQADICPPPADLQRLVPFAAAPSGHGVCHTAVIGMPAPRPTGRRVSGEQMTLAPPRITATSWRSAGGECEQALSTRCCLSECQLFLGAEGKGDSIAINGTSMH